MRRLVVLLALVLAGCGGSKAPERTPVPTATATAVATVGSCQIEGVRSTPVRFKTSDHLTLVGEVTGSGPVGAVLVHEYPLDHCGWMQYAGYLADHGVTALAFDLRCFGDSDCPSGRGHALTDVAAAIDELKRRGARKVAVVGASMGGAIAIQAGAELHPAAVVSLSGEKTTAGLTPGVEVDAGKAAPHISAPALFAVARGDDLISPADTRAMARAAKHGEAIVLPTGTGHGYELLLGTDTEWSPLARRIAAFIRRHAS